MRRTFAKSGGNRRGKPGGFTLVELAVYLAFSSLIVVSAIQVLSSSQDSQERGTQESDAMQNVRASMAMITRETRAAGSGIPSSAVSASYDDQTMTVYPIEPLSDVTGFTISGALDSIGTSLTGTMPAYTTDIKCNSVAGFSVGDLVAVTDNVTAHMFQVTSINSEQKKLLHAASSPYNPSAVFPDWPPTGYGIGSSVRKLEIVTYYVDENEQALMRQAIGEDPAYVAGGIASLDVSYLLADGSTSENPPDPLEIRAITFTMRSQSEALRHGDCASQVLATTVAPRCVIR